MNNTQTKKGGRTMTHKKVIPLLLVLMTTLPFAATAQDELPAPFNKLITNQTSPINDQNETSIAISSLSTPGVDLVQLVGWHEYVAFEGLQPGYAFTTNGGATWTSGFIPDAEGHPGGTDPSVAFDRFGYAYYCYLAMGVGTFGRVYLVRSTNLGSSWLP